MHAAHGTLILISKWILEKRYHSSFSSKRTFSSLPSKLPQKYTHIYYTEPLLNRASHLFPGNNVKFKELQLSQVEILGLISTTHDTYLYIILPFIEYVIDVLFYTVFSSPFIVNLIKSNTVAFLIIQIQFQENLHIIWVSM